MLHDREESGGGIGKEEYPRLSDSPALRLLLVHSPLFSVGPSPFSHNQANFFKTDSTAAA